MKLPAQGGSAIQVTEVGGQWPAESWDGKSLYYFRDQTIWRRDLPGDTETRVIHALSPIGGDWRQCGKDVCLIDRFSGNFVKYDPSAKTKHITPLDVGPFANTDVGIDVSPDGRWVIYSRADSVESDIMMVENFR